MIDVCSDFLQKTDQKWRHPFLNGWWNPNGGRSPQGLVRWKTSSYAVNPIQSIGAVHWNNRVYRRDVSNHWTSIPEWLMLVIITVLGYGAGRPAIILISTATSNQLFPRWFWLETPDVDMKWMHLVPTVDRLYGTSCLLVYRILTKR